MTVVLRISSPSQYDSDINKWIDLRIYSKRGIILTSTGYTISCRMLTVAACKRVNTREHEKDDARQWREHATNYGGI